MSIILNKRTGSVSLKNFDAGIIETMKPVIRVDNSGKSGYYLDIPELIEDRYVPIIFVFPEQTIEKYILPSIVIRRDDIALDLVRWASLAIDYRVPAENAVQKVVNGVVGYDYYEQKMSAFPYNITYGIDVFTRFRNHSVLIFNKLLTIYPPYGVVYVKDSLGEIRSYDAFMENVNHIEELTDVADRVIGFSLMVRVEAELDSYEPEVIKSMEQFTINLNQS